MLLGLTGALRSGKDTSYTLLKEIIDEEFPEYRAVRDAFADRLKISALRALFGETGDFDVIEKTNELKDIGKIGITIGEHYHEISGRQYLQFYGTEAHRDIFGEDFWVRQVIPVGAIIDRSSKLVKVITDVRFPNEAEAIHEAGGIVWRIVRPSDTLEDKHSSEIPLPESLVDYVIINDGSLEDLRDKLRSSLQEFKVG